MTGTIFKYILIVLIAGVFLNSCQSTIRFSSKTTSTKKIKAKNVIKTEISDNENVKIYEDSEICLVAEEWIGTPYKFGGTDRSGIDCSGLVQQVFSTLGKELPRTSQQQYDFVSKVEFLDKKAGDLIFFKNKKSINHVGIYVGNGYMIHASTSSGVIRQSIFENYFVKNLAGIGRVKNFFEPK
ncbi:NlpC/P60 family protein [Candidatus Kapaibacterium sp.]